HRSRPCNNNNHNHKLTVLSTICINTSLQVLTNHLSTLCSSSRLIWRHCCTLKLTLSHQATFLQYFNNMETWNCALC
ncbi:hypothetical protein HDU76_010336, partial [Blyttiomyces sp. JEL0837]